jgi:hypothetical protein
MDSVFRSPVESSPIKEVEISKPQADVHDTAIEPPFTDYEKVHNHPFSVDYFDLGSMWNKDEAYTSEVSTIEGYLRHCIDQGQANTKESAKATVKKLEKIIGIKNTDRTVVRVGRLAAYIKFLNESDSVLSKVQKYGH